MKVISPTEGRTRPSARGMGYLEAATPDLSPIARGLSALGASFEARAEKDQAQKDKLKNYKSIIAFNEFQTGADELQLSLKKGTDPAQDNYMETFESEYTNYENKFIESLDPDFQEEYKMRASQVRQSQLAEARKFQDTQRGAYYRTGIDVASDKAKATVAANTNNLQTSKDNIDYQIDAMDPDVISDLEKAELKRLNAKTLESVAYAKEVEKGKISGKQYTNEMAQGINDLAIELGVNPIDLATVISFESAGTFSTSIRGGKNNQHIGLIQFGENEQKQYGAAQGQSPREQLQAVKAYLIDRGFKPGMGILDLYSTINAGSPGRYGASDAAHGGTAGTVLDKVSTQMGGHREKAIKLLGGSFEIPDGLDNDPRFNNVPYEDRIALRKTAEANAAGMMTDLAAQQKAAQASYMNDLMVGILDGKNGRNDVDEARELGILTDYDQISKAYAAIDKRDEEANALLLAQQKIAGKVPFDPLSEGDRDLVDTMFAKSGIDGLLNADPEYMKNNLGPIVAQTNMIPRKAVGMLAGMIRGTDQKRQLYAINALAMFRDNNPGAYHSVPEDLKQKVDIWQANRGQMDQKELSDLLADRVPQEKRQARKLLEEEADRLMSDPKTNEIFSIDKLLDDVTEGFFENNAELPAIAAARIGMINERNAAIRENYVKIVGAGGTPEMAVQAADQQILRTWGTTDFGGRTVLMKFPPGKAGYTPIAGSMKWLEDQVREEKRIMPGVNLQLISDNITAEDIAAGRPPSYEVAAEENGVWRIVTTPGKRQTFEVTPQLKMQEIEHTGQLQEEAKYSQMLKSAVEAQQHSNLSGIPVPQEILDDLQDQRERVRVGKEAIEQKKSKQGPPATPQGTLRPEGPLALNLLRSQGKPKRVVPGVDVKTLENYPPPALGMVEAGNIELNAPIEDAYVVDAPEFGGVVLLPKIDGLSKGAAFTLYQETANHLGVFQDEASAMEYLMSFKRKKK